MSHQRSTRATATQLRKIKTRADQIMKLDSSIIRARALDQAAREFRFRDYDDASRPVVVQPQPAMLDVLSTSLPSGLKSLSSRTIDFVDLLIEIAHHVRLLQSDEHLEARYRAIGVWRAIVEASAQRELDEVQHLIADKLELSKAYFEVVSTAIDLQPKLDRFPYSSSVIIQFDIPDWTDTAPVVHVDESSRRALLKRLKLEGTGNFTDSCEVRLSRLAMVMPWAAPDIPTDEAIFHTARSAFHLYDTPIVRTLKPRLFRAKHDEVVSGASLSVIATLSLSSGIASDWEHADELALQMTDLIPNELELSFVGHPTSTSPTSTFNSHEAALKLGDGPWSGISRLDLPSPPGVTNERRRHRDPFVLRVVPVSDGFLRHYDISIAAAHLRDRPEAFQQLTRKTAAPAMCIGWCDHYLRTIRAAGAVTEIITA